MNSPYEAFEADDARPVVYGFPPYQNLEKWLFADAQ
jgi:hypothetical protein